MVNLDSYDKEIVDEAFRLQAKIKRDGLQGIGYMDAANHYLETNAASTTSKWVGAKLKNRGFR